MGGAAAGVGLEAGSSGDAAMSERVEKRLRGEEEQAFDEMTPRARQRNVDAVQRGRSRWHQLHGAAIEDEAALADGRGR
jgi:hypothetical protein